MRDHLRNHAWNQGWRRLEVWHSPATDVADDYFLRGLAVVRVMYDRLDRVRGAHRWGRGERGVLRLDRFAQDKAKQVIGWIYKT